MNFTVKVKRSFQFCIVYFNIHVQYKWLDQKSISLPQNLFPASRERVSSSQCLTHGNLMWNLNKRAKRCWKSLSGSGWSRDWPKLHRLCPSIKYCIMTWECKMFFSSIKMVSCIFFVLPNWPSKNPRAFRLRNQWFCGQNITLHGNFSGTDFDVVQIWW